MKKFKTIIFVTCIIAITGCGKIRALREYKFEQHQMLSENVYISIGWGGNSGVITLQNCVIIVDTKMAFGAEKFHNSLKDKLSDRKIYIINTHLHNDHTDGNYLFDADIIYIPAYSDEFWNSYVLKENSIDKLKYEKISSETSIIEGNDVIKIIPVGAAHTENDLVVYYENKQILFAGDLVFNKYHPYLDKNSGANADKWVKALKNISNKYKIKYVVPGHGPVAQKPALNEIAGYFTDINVNINDEFKLSEIRKKYSGFDDLPGKTSFKKTAEFIRQKKNNNGL